MLNYTILPDDCLPPSIHHTIPSSSLSSSTSLLSSRHFVYNIIISPYLMYYDCRVAVAAPTPKPVKERHVFILSHRLVSISNGRRG